MHICTPPQTHVPLALEAMQAGARPLIEKPPALSLREMRTLADAVAKTGIPVLTVFQHRYGPAAVRLRALIADGSLGRPLVATCETQWYRDDEYFAVPWRGLWNVEGGGPTMGHGIHQFDLLLSLLGPWRSLSAMAARQVRPTDTEDVSVAITTFESGALATIVNSLLSPRETSRLRIDFEYATVELEHLYGYREQNWRFTPAPGHEELTALWQPSEPDVESGHVLQFAAIYNAIAAGVTPGVSLQDAWQTMEFTAAIYASAFRGKVIHAGELIGDEAFMDSMDGGEVPWAPIKGVLA